MPESYSVLEACQVYILEYTQVTIIDRRIGVDQDFIDLQHNCQLEVSLVAVVPVLVRIPVSPVDSPAAIGLLNQLGLRGGVGDAMVSWPCHGPGIDVEKAASRSRVAR